MGLLLATAVAVIAACGPFGARNASQEASGARPLPTPNLTGIEIYTGAGQQKFASEATEPPPVQQAGPPDYAAADGSHYFGRTGFAIRNEPGGAPFLREYWRLGGVGGLGLPVSRAFRQEDGTIYQAFERGVLEWRSERGQAAVVSGAAAIPARAKEREQPPPMAVIGKVQVTPLQIVQGRTVVLRVWAPAATEVSATVEGRRVPFARDGESFVGLVGFYRLARPGARPVTFTVVNADGSRHTRNEPGDAIEVVEGDYPVEKVYFGQSAMSLLSSPDVAADNAKLNNTMSGYHPERRWTGYFQHPIRGVELTAAFGERWSINNAPVSWAHEGVDYGAPLADPVRAPASGRVVLVERLTVQGNTVVVDHGWGVFSAFFHLSEFKVQVGQDVSPGDVIGLVGDTGWVTGPHIHWEVRVGNMHVEPLEWLSRADLLFR